MSEEAFDDEQPDQSFYDVGYCRPPAQHRFRRGEPSPNPAGRPKKNAKIDIAAVFKEPVQATLNGKQKAMHPFEAELRSLAKLARAGNMAAAKEFIMHCQRAGLFDIPEEEEDDHQWVVYVPKDWDLDEWLKMYREFGLPPWPGERDGLIPIERREAINEIKRW